jgi:predicted dehydrogenase
MHEAAMRWTPATTRVFAQMTTFEPTRPNPRGEGDLDVTVPDSVQVLTQLAGGARGIYHISGIDLYGPGRQIHMYGSHATIKLEITPHERLLIGRIGDTTMQEVDIPAEKRGGWRVEAEFIGAIRGEEPVKFTDFETGVKYMEFTEAAHRSADTNQPVTLPL